MRGIVWIIVALVLVTPGVAAETSTSTAEDTSASSDAMQPSSGTIQTSTTGPEPTGCRPYCV